jgi:hypothetical protein
VENLKFDFVEVITRDGVVIEVRDRKAGKLETTIEPDLFLYMVKKAEARAQGRPFVWPPSES